MTEDTFLSRHRVELLDLFFQDLFLLDKLAVLLGPHTRFAGQAFDQLPVSCLAFFVQRLPAGQRAFGEPCGTRTLDPLARLA